MMGVGDASAPEHSSDRVLGRETFRRLVRAIGSFLTSEVGGRARALAVLLLVLLLGINALNVVNSYVSRYFMTAIERREWSDFVRMAALYVGVFAALTCTAVFYRFIEERLGLLWRDWLTRRLVAVYLDERTYYRLNVIGTLGNPDQRIADDVRAFTASTLSFGLVFLNGAFTIVAFSGVLWSISWVLFVTAVAYAALGSLSAIVLGRPLIGLNYDQSDKEANFRSHLIHVRENAESVALLQRESYLGARLNRHVDALTANLKRIIAVNRNLGFFTTGYEYLIQIIPVLIVAPLFIRGEAEFGTIPQSSMAFAHLLGAFSLVVKQFPQLSTYAAVVARLNALVTATEAASERTEGDLSIVEDRDRFAFERVTLVGPHDGRTIIRDLSFEARPGSRLLIVTPSEVETVVVQRAAAGIWRSGSGRIVRPGTGEIVFFPDRPYLPPGTLRDLLEGFGRAPVTDEQIRAALRTVGVENAVDRAGGLDVERDWDDLLSLEEQRLLSLAQVFLAEPRFAVLARLHANLGPERAARLVDELAGRGVGCVVLGDGAIAAEPFEAVIEVAPDGGWTKTK
jgi:vitamin B12/bleomycin/antimicrobial peptide transport system ATP-binding/permease protein